MDGLRARDLIQASQPLQHGINLILHEETEKMETQREQMTNAKSHSQGKQSGTGVQVQMPVPL